MTDQLVLKRVAVPDKETLREVRWEVDVMVGAVISTSSIPG